MKAISSFGWSEFAKKRHIPGAGYSYFNGSDIELFKLISDNWNKRFVGAGTTDINAVCIVPVPPDKFCTSNIMIENATNIETIVHKRREGEEPFLKTVANGPTVKANYAKIVLYSADELKKDTLDGKTYDSPYEWKIVCIIASDTDDEPMLPLAMARNQLEKAGGNPRQYSGEEYAKAIYYWSQRVSVKPTL